ncbi:hypothetical protein CU098_007488 [Rhizopus stolonifer]|uniref:Uncharacterized protein n=1 Tax=Rhizopus stolonifer TaxID=4846 RepID=A0A367IY53_RHIST|nr:hypothetical protein CU098_007488 [Rhizopus stolonifer]
MSVPAYTKTDLYELCNIEAAAHQVDLTICDGDWVSEFIISESFNNRARPLRLASNVPKRLRRSPSSIEVRALAQTEGSAQSEIQLQAEGFTQGEIQLQAEGSAQNEIQQQAEGSTQGEIQLQVEASAEVEGLTENELSNFSKDRCAWRHLDEGT